MQKKTLFAIAVATLLIACGQVNTDSPEAGERQAPVNGVTVDLAWVDQFGAPPDPNPLNPAPVDQANAVDTDAQGNVYVAGFTSGTLPGQQVDRRPDFAVRKYDADGSVLWTRQFGAGDIEVATGIAVDATGVYVVGTETFASANQGTRINALVLKYTPDGALVWAREFEFDDSVRTSAHGIALDQSGLYIVGEVGASDHPRLSGEPFDAFIHKLDREGNALWTERFGTAEDDRANAVDASASGVYVAGTTAGGLGQPTSAGGIDAFVRQYSRSGQPRWTRQFGTAGEDGVDDVAAVDDAVYFGGATSGTLPGQTSFGGFDGAIAKLDADGGLEWVRQFGTAANDFYTGLDADSSGVVLSGSTLGSLPGSTNDGASDAFAQKRSPDGDILWTFQFGTSVDDFTSDIAIDGRRFDVVGTTWGAFEGFDSQGRTDAFVAQLREEDDTTPPPAECEVLEGDLIVNSPADTAQTEPFDGCFDVTGGVYVQDTAGITDLSFLSGLRSVGEFLAITDSADLVSLDGLDDLERVDIGLVIEGNTQLESATSMTSLRRVEGPMHIFGNPALEQLEFAALEHAGTLVVGGNDALVSLDICALEFAGLLHIENNDVLAGFCFDALSQVDGRFRIAYNHALPTCAAQALLQDVGPANVRGLVTIEGNDDSGSCP